MQRLVEQVKCDRYEMLWTIYVPFVSGFFLVNGGGFFSLPLLAFWPSLLSLEASAMLVPELEATEEAASIVSAGCNE